MLFRAEARNLRLKTQDFQVNPEADIPQHIGSVCSVISLIADLL
jgi:hypothetical protein